LIAPKTALKRSWNAARQIEELRQPLAFFSAEFGDRHEIVGSANHRADRNGDDVDQRVNDFACSRIGQFDKMVRNSRGNFRGHGRHPEPLRFARRQPSSSINEPHRPIHTKLPTMAQSPWSHTELGTDYEIYEEDGEKAQQYQTDTGPLDILAISKDKKRLLVVELKKGRASDVVVGQTLRYMGFVQEKLAEEGQSVFGLIIAHEDDKKSVVLSA
jgi:hypothetical protein